MLNVHFTDDDLKGDEHSSGESSGSVATRAVLVVLMVQVMLVLATLPWTP